MKEPYLKRADSGLRPKGAENGREIGARPALDFDLFQMSYDLL
jgi:hypothetical protein